VSCNEGIHPGYVGNKEEKSSGYTNTPKRTNSKTIEEQ
jgi:hypothetical protein